MTQKEVEDLVYKHVSNCRSGCVRWFWLIGVGVVLLGSLLGAGWAVSVTKLDSSAFAEHEKVDRTLHTSMAVDICELRILVTRMYNEDLPVEKHWPEPLCDNGGGK